MDPASLNYQLAHAGDNKTPSFIASVSVVVCLATVGVGLRLLARRLTKATLEADDYVIILALVMAWGMFVGNIYEGKFGQGKHMATLQPNQLEDYGKVWAYQSVLKGVEIFVHPKTVEQMLYYEDLMYPSAILLIQTSVLLLYRRIFTFQSPRFRIAVISVACLSLACWVSIFFATVFSCIPIEYNWNRKIDGHCGNPNALFNSGLALNLFNDICIILLPIPIIWRIQITRAEKIGLSSTFLLGGFVCIGNLIRLPYLINVQQDDLTWSLAEGAVWSTSEVCIGILSACLPCFRPFIRITREHWTSRTGKTDSETLGMKPRRANYSLNTSNTHRGWSELPKEALSASGPSLGLESEIRSSQPDLTHEEVATDGGIRVKHEVFMTETKSSAQRA